MYRVTPPEFVEGAALSIQSVLDGYPRNISGYLSYLLIQLAGTLCVNAYVAHLAEKQYPEISKYKDDRLNGGEKRQLLKDTGALFLTKVGHVALNGTDNIIISAVVGVLWVGRLSNYTLICDSVTSVLCQITAAITGSKEKELMSV